MIPRLHIRQALRDDLPEIVRLLAADPHVADRELYRLPLLDSYIHAFDAIDRDHNQLLIVAEQDQEIVGTFQLSFMPNISFRGGWRALIAAVTVASHRQGKGIGRAMMDWAIQEAKARHCCFMHLVTDKQRTNAHRFYEKLGFHASHEGFKLGL